MTEMTCEFAERLLKAACEGFPEKGRVIQVVEDAGAWLCKWTDGSAERLNADSVSDPDDPDVARNAQEPLQELGFSAVWENEGEDGKPSYAVHTLSDEDILSRLADAFVPVDKRN